MHKLLVAFDGSESALRALRYAIRLAQENAPVALHVMGTRDMTAIGNLVMGSVATKVVQWASR